MRTLLILLLSITLASCGSLNKSVRKQTTDSTSIQATRQANVSIITEKLDTSVQLKGDTAKATKPLDNLVKGDTLKASTNGTSVEVFYNPVTGNIHAKAITEPRLVPVIIDRTTELRSETESIEEREFHQAIESKDVEREESSLLNPWLWVVWLIILLALLYLLYRFKNKILNL